MWRYEWTVFFFNDTATTEIYTLSLHDALPIFTEMRKWVASNLDNEPVVLFRRIYDEANGLMEKGRSEEHTSELQSRRNLVCRLLLEKKKPLRGPNVQRKGAPLWSVVCHPF